MEKNQVPMVEKGFVAEIKSILEEARSKSYAAISSLMTNAYWHIGQRIVEQEQQGADRAEYGKQLMETLSAELTKEYGKGYSVSYLRTFRQFYLEFPDYQIQQTRLVNLSWSHYLRVMRVESLEARVWYLNEAAANSWSIRTLDRNISTLYYERLLMSQKNEPVVAEMEEKSLIFQSDKYEFIKNPYVLEFLNLPSSSGYLESELESALIEQLKQFMLELGKGFAFIERQQHLRTETDSDIAKYSILNGNEQLFASKYKLFLPTEAELKAEIEREKRVFNLKNGVR